MKKRCHWVTEDQIYIDYHDTEWGVPIYDDKLLFEFITLEGAQAGLSWLTILKRRENYRIAFDQFDVEKIVRYDDHKITSLMNDDGIIRNRLKIESTIGNAKAYLKLLETHKSFSDYLWQFVDGKPIKNQWQNQHELPSKTLISDALARDLQKRGFKFVGSTICYAFMQAVGMVNDHITSCFCYKEEA